MLIDPLSAKILVTGGSGFIGKNFIDFWLRQKGFDGHVVNLDALTYASNIEVYRNASHYTFVHANVCDSNVLSDLFQTYQFDGVVHFASESHVDRSIDSPELFLQSNLIGIFNLLEILRDHPNCHLHYVSTDEVYGDLTSRKQVVEGAAYNPSTPYAATKAAADHFVRVYGKVYGISYTIDHSSNNYGPYQHDEKLVPKMIGRCLKAQPLTIHGKGSHIRDWLFVDDHVRAIYAILTSGNKYESYNIGGKCERSSMEIIDLIIQIVSEKTGISTDEMHKQKIFVPDRPGNDLSYSLNITKAKNKLGWQPEMPIYEGLTKTVEWYLEKESDLCDSSKARFEAVSK